MAFFSLKPTATCLKKAVFLEAYEPLVGLVDAIDAKVDAMEKMLDNEAP